mgnify:CR=1 FL=1
MKLWELEIQINELVSKYLEESGAVEVFANELGLDYRIGRVYVSLEEDWVAVKGGTRMIEYYGGFEYIDPEFKTAIGCVTFYEEADRVSSCLEHYRENLKENSEGDE